MELGSRMSFVRARNLICEPPLIKILVEGGPLNFQLPDAIEPGDYLLRAEIVALHNTPGEIYPSCTQVRFSERSGDPTTPSDSIKLPGGYVTSDPGFNYNVS